MPYGRLLSSKNGLVDAVRELASCSGALLSLQDAIRNKRIRLIRRLDRFTFFDLRELVETDYNNISNEPLLEIPGEGRSIEMHSHWRSRNSTYHAPATNQQEALVSFGRDWRFFL